MTCQVTLMRQNEDHRKASPGCETTMLHEKSVILHRCIHYVYTCVYYMLMIVNVYCTEVLSTHTHTHIRPASHADAPTSEALDRLVEKMRPAPLVRCPVWFQRCSQLRCGCGRCSGQGSQDREAQWKGLARRLPGFASMAPLFLFSWHNLT